MINVVFVCLGNICRSPMAEGVFQHLVNEAGLGDKINVDSAGTGNWHVGQRAHHGTRDILNKHEIAYDGRARQFIAADLDTFDYILAMDDSNFSNIRRLAGDADDKTITMFLQYANDTGLTDITDVPDPYYTSGFDYVYDLVQKGAQALLDHIRKTHGL